MALPAGLLALGLLAGCSGQPCDDLGALQVERDERRAVQQQLVDDGTATSDEIGAADDRLHAFERRVHELEGSCGRG